MNLNTFLALVKQSILVTVNWNGIYVFYARVLNTKMCHSKGIIESVTSMIC